MRIAVVSSTMFPARRAWLYGSEVQAWLLADGLGRLGHAVSLYAAAGSEGSPNIARLRYLPRTPMLTYDAECYAVDRYSDELSRADVIVDMSATMAASEWAHWSGQKPYLAFRNGMDLSHPRIMGRRNLVVLSDLVLQANPEATAEVCPYGVDTALYSPWTVARHGFAYVSRPHPHKGLFQFLDIARAVPEENFWLMYTTTTEEHRAHADRALADLPPNVIPVCGNSDFDGRLKVKLYRSARALLVPLSPEYREAFGLVFAEAMAAGCPFISRAGSMSTTQWEGSPSLLLDGSTESYVEAIRSFKGVDPFVCRQFVEDRGYTADAWVHRVQSLCALVTKGDRW